LFGLVLLIQVVRMPLNFLSPFLSVDKVPTVKTINISEYENMVWLYKILSTDTHTNVKSSTTIVILMQTGLLGLRSVKKHALIRLTEAGASINLLTQAIACVNTH